MDLDALKAAKFLVQEKFPSAQYAALQDRRKERLKLYKECKEL
jgi:hypothetical protein